MKNYIFVTEDDENIVKLLECSLDAFNYKVKVFLSAEDLLKATLKELPILILLDIMLPGMDGISALKELKSDNRTKDIPVIMVTAKNSEIDKVKALEIGADDYITKPFSVLELGARIKSVLRRTYSRNEENILSYKQIKIDKENYKAYVEGKEVLLRRKEYEVLRYLIENKGRVATRDELLNKVWGYDYVGESRTLDMHIKTLREKLSSDKEKYIQTIRGIGFRLKE